MCNLDEIVMYGTTWCGDCVRSKAVMQEYKINYQWVDIDLEKGARQYVEKVNKGRATVPTIIFPDGEILVEPSNLELKSKLGV